MKVVKSADALKRLALARGSSASVGGVKFNSTSDRVDSIPLGKPEPPPEPKPEPPAAVQELPRPQQDNTELLTKIAELLARPVPEIKMPDIVMPEIRMPDIVMPEIKMPDLQWPAAPAAQPAQKISWVFKVERDVRGFMTQVVATSKPD